MENVLAKRLQSVSFAAPQCFKNITILPLLSKDEGSVKYLTLSQALASGSLLITEVSANGTVPELMVVNRGTTAVLLLDGEELAGAKQNRVLNTSILLKESSETKIPVSCTERGRWSHVSPSFNDSGNVMEHKSRAKKASSVSQSLEFCASFASDQAQVWSDIDELHAKANVHSPTSAMKDVFEAREQDLRKASETFQCVPSQVGIFAFIDGRPAGFDLLSRSAAYAQLHSKLVKSYALDALLEPKDRSVDPSPASGQAKEFLIEVSATKDGSFPSIGYGMDHRFTGRCIAGTALVYQDEVIHSAFFRLTESDQASNMASLRNRRRRFQE